MYIYIYCATDAGAWWQDSGRWYCIGQPLRYLRVCCSVPRCLSSMLSPCTMNEYVRIVIPRILCAVVRLLHAGVRLPVGCRWTVREDACRRCAFAANAFEEPEPFQAGADERSPRGRVEGPQQVYARRSGVL